MGYYSNGRTLISTVASHDFGGSMLSVVLDDSLTYPGDATVSYTYDDLHRLTRETCVLAQGSYRTAYDYRYYYDAVGNRTRKDVWWESRYYYMYSPRNELTSEGTYDENEEYVADVNYTYDLRGNLVKKGDADANWYWNYYWSADDKLTKEEYWVFNGYDDYNREKMVEYKYDLLRRRVARRLTTGYQQPGPWRWYFYDGLQVVAEGSGTSDKMYYSR
jgi:hypothetical protein